MARNQAARVGKPAEPLNVETWVNGPPLSDADLKGKVVLLDRWRKWARPGSMFAAPSEFQKWSKKYADKGFVIISLASHGRHLSGLTGPEKQQAFQLEQAQFADLAHDRGLTHRIGILKDDPQVRPPAPSADGCLQVIDREGKVRLVTAGRPDLVKVVDELLEALVNGAAPK